MASPAGADHDEGRSAGGLIARATVLPSPPVRGPAWRDRQAFRANFWNVWQVAGTWPRLAANVHVTSLT